MGWQVCEEFIATPTRNARIKVFRSASQAVECDDGRTRLCRGVAKLVKAPDFDSGIRRFESFFPCHYILQCPNGPARKAAGTSRQQSFPLQQQEARQVHRMSSEG